MLSEIMVAVLNGAATVFYGLMSVVDRGGKK